MLTQIGSSFLSSFSRKIAQRLNRLLLSHFLYGLSATLMQWPCSTYEYVYAKRTSRSKIESVARKKNLLFKDVSKTRTASSSPKRSENRVALSFLDWLNNCCSEKKEDDGGKGRRGESILLEFFRARDLWPAVAVGTFDPRNISLPA